MENIITYLGMISHSVKTLSAQRIAIGLAQMKHIEDDSAIQAEVTGQKV